MRISRRQVFVDPEVQGLLLTRAIANWLLSLALVAIAFVVVQLMFGGTEPASANIVRSLKLVAPPLVLCLMALPVVAWHSVRTSNRFAGPIFRLQRAMKLLANGEMPDRIVFREKDCWKELASDFNQLARRISILEQEKDFAESFESMYNRPTDQ